MVQELDFTSYPDYSNLVYSEDNRGTEVELHDYFEILRFDPSMAMMGANLSHLVRCSTGLDLDRFGIRIMRLTMNAENDGEKDTTCAALQIDFPDPNDKEAHEAVRGLVDHLRTLKDTAKSNVVAASINPETFVIQGEAPRDLLDFLRLVTPQKSLNKINLEEGKIALKQDWVLSALPQRLHTTKDSLYADAYKISVGDTPFSYAQIQEAVDIQERLDAHIKNATTRYAAPTFNPYWH